MCIDMHTPNAHSCTYVHVQGCAAILFSRPDEAHATMSYGGGYLATPTVGV